MEADLAPMIEDEGAEASMDELLCPICLDLLHLPHSLQPCQHLFCDPCLRRLAGARIHKCPVCRSPIKDCHLDQELHDSIEDQHQDVYIQRQQDEMASGIFNEPLPPVRGTLAEIFHFRQGLLLLLLSMVSLMILIQFGIIIIFLMPMALLLVPIQIGTILMLNLIFDLIHDQTEESPLVAFYQSLVRVKSLGYRSLGVIVLTITRQFNDYEAYLDVPGEDQTQEPQI